MLPFILVALSIDLPEKGCALLYGSKHDRVALAIFILCDFSKLCYLMISTSSSLMLHFEASMLLVLSQSLTPRCLLYWLSVTNLHAKDHTVRSMKSNLMRTMVQDGMTNSRALNNHSRNNIVFRRHWLFHLQRRYAMLSIFTCLK